MNFSLGHFTGDNLRSFLSCSGKWLLLTHVHEPGRPGRRGGILVDGFSGLGKTETFPSANRTLQVKKIHAMDFS